MTLEYDLYWSFRSPYSYMVTPRLMAMEAKFNVRCKVRPVYPLAVRTPEFFDGCDPLWFRYFVTDVFREAAFLGLPFRWPRPDPVQQAPGVGYRREQPYIHRLTHLDVAATERGRGLALLAEASRVIWSGEVDDWHLDDHLARAAERAGLDYAQLSTAVDGDSARHAAIFEANQITQREAGHWGVPMMVFGGAAFFGQDRVDQLKWRLEQHGLDRR